MKDKTDMPFVSRPLVCMLLIVLSATASAKDWHRNLTFEEACKKAKAEKKLVFVNFHAVWCGPCKMMDESTFRDPKVIEWLTKHTVAIKVDGDKNLALTSRYRVDSFPTLLFLKPDGTVVDRLLGLQTSEQLLTAGAGVLEGKDAEARARDALKAGDATDPILHMQLATALTGKGKTEAALREYLWCLDHAFPKHPEALDALQYLVREVLMLGQRYRPALAELTRWCERAKTKLLEEKSGAEDVTVLFAINNILGEKGENLRLYDQLRTRAGLDPEVKKRLVQLVIPELLAARRYADVAADIDVVAAINDEFVQYEAALATLHGEGGTAVPPEHRERFERSLKGRLIFVVTTYYQVLIGLDRNDDAKTTAARLVKVDASYMTYNALAWSGYLTGKPSEVHLEQARQAHKLSEGRNVSVIDTLARILHARGKKTEAIKLAKEGLAKATTPQERALMERCLRELQ